MRAGMIAAHLLNDRINVGAVVRDTLRRDGWWWLLVEAALVAVLALASMGLDRWRQRKKVRSEE